MGFCQVGVADTTKVCDTTTGVVMKGKRCAIWELVFNAVGKFGNIFRNCHGFAEVTTGHSAPFSRKASESHTDTAHWGKNVNAPWPDGGFVRIGTAHLVVPFGHTGGGTCCNLLPFQVVTCSVSCPSTCAERLGWSILTLSKILPFGRFSVSYWSPAEMESPFR